MENNPSPPALCPHCGEEVTPGQSVCPNCGTSLRSAPQPQPGRVPPLPPRMLTGRAWGDLLLGAAVQYLAHLVTTRLLFRTIPASNPANFSEFIGITQDWNRSRTIFNVTLLEIAEVTVFGLLFFFVTWRSYPLFARGFGYAALALLVILLGAFFTCRPLRY